MTTSTPEQFVAGLTDFAPGRSKLFANSHDDTCSNIGGCSGHTYTLPPVTKDAARAKT